jgi:hypothetical protein
MRMIGALNRSDTMTASTRGGAALFLPKRRIIAGISSGSSNFNVGVEKPAINNHPSFIIKNRSRLAARPTDYRRQTERPRVGILWHEFSPFPPPRLTGQLPFRTTSPSASSIGRQSV